MALSQAPDYQEEEEEEEERDVEEEDPDAVVQVPIDVPDLGAEVPHREEQQEACRAPSSVSDDSKSSNNGKLLDKISFKNTRQSRLRNLSSFCKNGRKQSRLQQLLNARRREFELKPEQERSQLRDAFALQDKDDSGSLNPEELLQSLVNLGLKPITEVEKKEILRCCHEASILGDVDFMNFVFKLVPEVRQRLRELRQGPLLKEFTMYDKDSSGSLDEDECTEILEKLCSANLDADGLAEMEKAFADIIAEVTSGSAGGNVDFEAFQDLVARAREHHQRIIGIRVSDLYREHHLDAEDVRHHSDELVLLHDSFRRADKGGDKLLDQDELGSLLIEYGLMPHEGHQESLERLAKRFAEADADGDSMITFREALHLLRLLRTDRLDREQLHLRKMFRRLDKDGSGSLDVTEVSALFAELGIQPKSRDDQLEIKRLLDEVDEDDSGDFSFDEFAFIVQRVQERLAISERRKQRLMAVKLALADQQVDELRHVFFILDTEDMGVLAVEKLRRALEILRVPMSTDDLQDLIDSVDEGGTGLVDFESFLRFFRAVVPQGSSAKP